MAIVPIEPIQYAQTSDGIVVIRVFGRGTHVQSPSLRYIFEKTRKNQPPPRYIVDLEQCTALDSTFMGTLASMALNQRKTAQVPMIATNIQPHVRYLMETLGLNFILDLRSAAHPDHPAMQHGAFQPVKTPEMSPVDRIVMMIEAHEHLVDVAGENEMKFEGVLKSLRESLDRAKQNPAP